MKPIWRLYVLRTRDGHLYTGITTDVDRRVREHKSGVRGAKALRGRGPLTLLFTAAIGSRSAALKAEHWVKKLRKNHKEQLLKNPDQFHSALHETQGAAREQTR